MSEIIFKLNQSILIAQPFAGQRTMAYWHIVSSYRIIYISICARTDWRAVIMMSRCNTQTHTDTHTHVVCAQNINHKTHIIVYVRKEWTWVEYFSCIKHLERAIHTDRSLSLSLSLPGNRWEIHRGSHPHPQAQQYTQLCVCWWRPIRGGGRFGMVKEILHRKPSTWATQH